jgi:predicted transglutaminase-like cysteine proteinase
MMVAAVIFRLFSAKTRTVLIAVLVASISSALQAVAGSERVAHAPVSEVTQPPPGWVAFCARRPRECDDTTTAPRDLVLSRRAWIDLARVNNWVNQTIKPLSDFEHWGVAERWSYPDDGYGDCEDYVLLKRRMLIQAGWPRETLLVTVVRDKNEDAHAVLMVSTDKGDYVLDNQNDDVLFWTETGYRFVKRQSQSNGNVWVSLGDPQPAPITATSP